FVEIFNLMIPYSITNVIYMNDVRNYINSYESELIIDNNSIEKIIKVIKENNIKSLRNKRKHRIYVKQKYK
ncbi:hypothetical protein, partial [Clostridium cadaveris]